MNLIEKIFIVTIAFILCELSIRILNFVGRKLEKICKHIYKKIKNNTQH